jgi:5-methylcytosine-specific restriction endonuclease McrA
MANAPKYRRLKTSEQRQPCVREKSAAERGYDNYWSTVIAPAVRERDEWLCQECLREGGLGMAMEEMMSRPRTKTGKTLEPIVDHIVPAHRRPMSQFHDWDNLQTICFRHHALKTADDLKKYGAAPR